MKKEFPMNMEEFLFWQRLAEVAICKQSKKTIREYIMKKAVITNPWFVSVR